MTEFLTLASFDENLIPVIAIAGGLGIAAICIVTRFITSVVQTKAHEESRREISAYVAEGSISAEEGERLINAGPKQKRCGW